VEQILGAAARVASELIEAAAVIVVAFASLEAFVQVLRLIVRPAAAHGERKAIWRQFGMWLVLGLEFELAADIIRSVVAPTRDDLVELAAIAVIRTFLNYFLEKDLEHAARDGAEPGPERAHPARA
jgi:uncharacterized membrane protein